MAAANLIPDKLCRKYSAIPVRFIDDSVLEVAMVDPANIFALDDLKIMTGFDIRPAIASTEDVFAAIAKLNRLDGTVTESDEERLVGLDEELADIREATEEAPIIKLVNSVIAQAVDDAASDIHFEPQAKELIVRFRMDGVLHEIMSIPRRMQSGVLSRLKIMAELDIAERRVPQDGRIGLVVGGKPIDMRVATLPTVYGEKVVMRLLDKSNVMLDLKDLGFAEKALKRYQRSFTKPYGAILVTGPTGSGKSTTLYATLNILNSREKNVITVEDPVEYRLSRHQPGAGEPEGRHDVRGGVALDPALRPRHRDDRRDTRPRDGADRRRVGAHRSPRPEHAAHKRRARRTLTPHRDGHRTVPYLVGRGLRPCPAPGASLVLAVQGALRADAGDAQEERFPARGGRQGRAADALPRQGLRPLQQHRLQGAPRSLRSDDRQRGDTKANGRAQECR